MTPEEAIEELKDASDSEVRYGDTERHYNEVMKRVEAFDMAIKALEQQSCDVIVLSKYGSTIRRRGTHGKTGRKHRNDIENR